LTSKQKRKKSQQQTIFRHLDYDLIA